MLCEGLWRQDNSVLSYIQPTGTVVRDAVSNAAANARLGDTGSDLIQLDSTLLVAVSTSQTLTEVDPITGEIIREQRTSGGREPYRLAVSNGSDVLHEPQ